MEKKKKNRWPNKQTNKQKTKQNKTKSNSLRQLLSSNPPCLGVQAVFYPLKPQPCLNQSPQVTSPHQAGLLSQSGIKGEPSTKYGLVYCLAQISIRAGQGVRNGFPQGDGTCLLRAYKQEHRILDSLSPLQSLMSMVITYTPDTWETGDRNPLIKTIVKFWL